MDGNLVEAFQFPPAWCFAVGSIPDTRLACSYLYSPAFLPCGINTYWMIDLHGHARVNLCPEDQAVQANALEEVDAGVFGQRKHSVPKPRRPFGL